ncbi:MAG: glycoside hydrolase family 57 protein [Bacteroidales bacterium]|nr:glycoside hydrolase family 57 protein [Bacteroidales bacterium]MBN2757863.1 glycoside hydrolase family 57 protein [Bacteroidales bacterium]
MKNICFYFQVHQPFRLKNYRFFNIGSDHNYYNEYSNRTIMRKVAEKCYLPTNQLMLDLINSNGSKFKISYSISGTAIDQFELYAPDVLESFKKLAETGCVEFISETYSHSLSALKSKKEFYTQIEAHKAKIEEHFGQTPQVFRNTELIYSDKVGEMIADLGYKAMLTEGAKHILGWKSPNYLYFNALNPKLKILLKNFKLSDDIAFRFSNKAWEEWPLTTEKFVYWINNIDKKEEVINLFMDYETFGEHQWAETGIFDFMRALPNAVFSNSEFKFSTPSEVADSHQPIAAYNVPYPISWADEERDLTAWLGNELQDEAFDKLYQLEEIVNTINDKDILKDWRYLQTSDHFYYMCTKFFSDGDVHMYFNPYDTPYQAFINFMNILSDFILRLKDLTTVESLINSTDISKLSNIEIEALIKKYEKIVEKLKSKIKTLSIEKTKVQAKAIDKVKPDYKKISATKKDVKVIDKKKPETKAISTEKPNTKAIEKIKKESKAILSSKKKTGKK